MLASPFTLQGKRALVTGGGTGLGFGITKAYLDAGAQVYITGRRIEKLKEAVEALGKRVSFIQNDITNLDALPGLINQIEDEGPLDILVNNAAINMKKHLSQLTDEEFNRIIQTNLCGTS